MNEGDRVRFAELMAWLAQTYATTLSPFDIENYWRFLSHYSLSEFEQAVVNYCRDPQGHTFMPKPGEIIACINGNSLSLAMRAWSKVIRAIKDMGAYSSVVFDDAVIHAVLYEMGGWVKICHCKEDDLPYRAREFEKRYIACLSQKSSDYPAQLNGIANNQNTGGSLEASQPILIGDEQAAYKVYEKGKTLERSQRYSSLNRAMLKLEQINQPPAYGRIAADKKPE